MHPGIIFGVLVACFLLIYYPLCQIALDRHRNQIEQIKLMRNFRCARRLRDLTYYERYQVMLIAPNEYKRREANEKWRAAMHTGAAVEELEREFSGYYPQGHNRREDFEDWQRVLARACHDYC